MRLQIRENNYCVCFITNCPFLHNARMVECEHCISIELPSLVAFDLALIIWVKCLSFHSPPQDSPFSICRAFPYSNLNSSSPSILSSSSSVLFPNNHQFWRKLSLKWKILQKIALSEFRSVTELLFKIILFRMLMITSCDSIEVFSAIERSCVLFGYSFSQILQI